MTVAAVILAAGMSTRMGHLKQLLPWKGSTILGSTIDLYNEADIDKTIVVVGYCADKIMKELSDKAVEWVVNEHYESGMATSLQAGIKALNKEVDICLLGLGDTPLLKTSTINKIIKTQQLHQSKLVVPFYQNQKGHPILMTRELFGELLNIRGDIGARNVIQAHQQEVFRLEVDDKGVIIDLDTPEIYQTFYDKYGR